jgi:multidrug efflux pump subunit AcrB
MIKPKEKNNGNETKKSITDYVQQGYEHILDWTFRHPWLTICVGIATVVICLLLIGPKRPNGFCPWQGAV